LSDRERKLNGLIVAKIRERGQNQNEFAEEMGVSPQLLSNVILFRRKYQSDLALLKRIYDVLEIEEEEVY
jgi:transcriptional regulator with XRE-family HTH domain